jgi:hypothetical protein
VVKMHEAVATSKAKCKVFSNKEFLVGLGIMIGATEFAKRGCAFFLSRIQRMMMNQKKKFGSLYVKSL